MRVLEMEITPEQALALLKRNPSNRNLRPSWVKVLAEIITRGEWQLTHQGIALDRDGNLLDGQHRLEAVAAAGIAVPMMVAFDCDPVNFTVLDAGIRRTYADHLRISGGEAALARVLHLLSQTKKAPAGAISSAQVAAMMAVFGEEIRAVAGKPGKFSSAPIRAAVITHMVAGRREVLEQLHALNLVDFNGMTPTVQSLVRQIMASTLAKRRDQLVIAARAWRAFHPDHAAAGRVIIVDLNVPLREIREVLVGARLKREELGEVFGSAAFGSMEAA